MSKKYELFFSDHSADLTTSYIENETKMSLQPVDGDVFLLVWIVSIRVILFENTMLKHHP